MFIFYRSNGRYIVNAKQLLASCLALFILRAVWDGAYFFFRLFISFRRKNRLSHNRIITRKVTM